jgi:hypothetical protein
MLPWKLVLLCFHSLALAARSVPLGCVFYLLKSLNWVAIFVQYWVLCLRSKSDQATGTQAEDYGCSRCNKYFIDGFYCVCAVLLCIHRKIWLIWIHKTCHGRCTINFVYWDHDLLNLYDFQNNLGDPWVIVESAFDLFTLDFVCRAKCEFHPGLWWSVLCHVHDQLDCHGSTLHAATLYDSLDNDSC